MLVRSWEFHLKDITIPIHIWHGEADVKNTLKYGKYLRNTIRKKDSSFSALNGNLIRLLIIN